MSEYVVELRNATKRFPGVVALKNMQLAVKPGEILGLIGENGAGKSTLIKVLTGVHKADEGEIYVNGEYWGLYLAVEGVEEAFLERNYGEDYGELYKPDSLSFGGGRGNGQAFDMQDFEKSCRAMIRRSRLRPMRMPLTITPRPPCRRISSARRALIAAISNRAAAWAVWAAAT